MLKKDTFCSIMNKLMCAYDADVKMDEIRMMCGSDFLGSDLSFLSEQVIELLAINMDVDEDTIAYFCYELDFGRSEMASAYEFDERDENGEWVEKVYDLSGAEKFYDYLIRIKNNEQ